MTMKSASQSSPSKARKSGRKTHSSPKESNVAMTVSPVASSPSTQSSAATSSSPQPQTPLNTINLEVPLPPLLRALRSAANASSASIRLTKKEGVPLLSLTITTHIFTSAAAANNNEINHDPGSSFSAGPNGPSLASSRERETTITQDVPIRVLPADSVAGLHEPRCREPDVHIVLPPLTQLKSVSDRFARLASGAAGAGVGALGGFNGGFALGAAGAKGAEAGAGGEHAR
ncbi:hypothetical protein MRB53_038722 [Persea americana]|nr:hypothetical protein MRB53_038722 [Persea americana]